MNEVILSGLGILLALCGMTVLIFRRVSPIIVGPLAALLVTVMSGLPVLDSVTGTVLFGLVYYDLVVSRILRKLVCSSWCE